MPRGTQIKCTIVLLLILATAAVGTYKKVTDSQPLGREARIQKQAEDAQIHNDLRLVGLTWLNFQEQKGVPPESLKDLRIEDKTGELTSRLSRLYSFRWGKRMNENGADPIGWQKAATSEGTRIVLFSNGDVAKVPENKFRTVTSQPD